MTNANYHTVFFQPIGYTNTQAVPFQGNLQSEWTTRLNGYFIKALYYIQAIVRLLRSSTPFFEQYGPVIQEIPKMYKLMKAFNEISDEESDKVVEEEGKNDLPTPTLFI